MLLEPYNIKESLQKIHVFYENSWHQNAPLR